MNETPTHRNPAREGRSAKGGTMSVNTITPKALAEEIGIDPKALRSYLRREFARAPEAKNTTWGIAPDAAEAAREHFAAKLAAKAKPEA